MGCLQWLGQPQRRGDFAVAGRNINEHTAHEHAAHRHSTGAATHAPAEEAEEEETQWLVLLFSKRAGRGDRNVGVPSCLGLFLEQIHINR